MMFFNMNNKNGINVLFKEKLPIIKVEIERLCTNFFFKNIDNPINMIELISPENYKNYIDLKEELPKDVSAELDNIFNDDKLNIKLSDIKEKIENIIKEILLNEKIDNNNFILPPLEAEISFFEDIKNIKRDFRKQMEDAMPNWFTNLFTFRTTLNNIVKFLLNNLYIELINLSNKKRGEFQYNILREILNNENINDDEKDSNKSEELEYKIYETMKKEQEILDL